MAYVSRSKDSINPYAVGNKIYGGGRSFPTMGAVDPLGYKERDSKASARRDAMLRRMQSLLTGKYASADANRAV